MEPWSEQLQRLPGLTEAEKDRLLVILNTPQQTRHPDIYFSQPARTVDRLKQVLYPSGDEEVHQELKKLRREMVEGFAARASSVTSPASIEAQGQTFLDTARVDDSAATADLAPFSETDALAELTQQLCTDHQTSLSAAGNEGPVQDFINKATPKLLNLSQQLHRSAHDTHASRLSSAGGSGQIKPDQCICVGLEPFPQQVDTVIEGKHSFTGQGLSQAAYQMVKRARQLRNWQPWRTTFVLMAVSHNEAMIWKLHFLHPELQSSISITTSARHRFSLSLSSPGFQLLTRLCQSQSRALGWTTAAVPTGLRLNGHPLSNVQLLAPYRSIRRTIVVQGTVDGVPVVAKSRFAKHEEDNYDRLAGLSNAYLCDLGRDGVARKIGVWEDSEQQRWMFIQPVGKPLDKVIQGNGKLLCDIICQAAHIADSLWKHGYVHGDLSPFNIIYDNGIVKLIDLQTLHQPKDGECPSHITGTPQFIALQRLAGNAASLATELESLCYCFLYFATDFSLHWKHAAHNEPAAIDMKAAPMAWPEHFERKVVHRIKDASLHKPSRMLRALFSPARIGQPADLHAFLKCFSA